MSASTNRGPAVNDTDIRAPAVAKRINVAVTPETVQALQLVIDREGVSLTEALRRLIGYGEFVYRAMKLDGADLLVKTKDTTREVVIL